MNQGGVDEVMGLDAIEKQIATMLVFQKVKMQDDEDDEDESEKKIRRLKEKVRAQNKKMDNKEALIKDQEAVIKS